MKEKVWNFRNFKTLYLFFRNKYQKNFLIELVIYISSIVSENLDNLGEKAKTLLEKELGIHFRQFWHHHYFSYNFFVS